MNMHGQSGLTLLGFLFALLVIGLCLTVAFRLGPLYLDNYTVAQSFEALGESDVRTLSDQASARRCTRISSSTTSMTSISRQ